MPLISPNLKNGRHATWPIPVKRQVGSRRPGRSRSFPGLRTMISLGSPLNALIQASVVKFETGLRVCPRCKKPLHLSADNCRECGMPVPRQ